VRSGMWLAFAVGGVCAAGESGSDEFPLLVDRPLIDGRAAAYVCRNFTCSAPTPDPAVLAGQLGAVQGEDG
ncbi:hypothetical protein G3I19_11740, partial [Streptomyces sp. SID10853]|uniref:hypothetical protein n=1 Tax=Streptomyces sp. SID10853 TaxID=2706028 RepID=UPI0013C0CE04